MHELSAKDLARRDLRRARADYVSSLTPAEREAAETALAGRIADIVRTAVMLASYAPMGHEIDPAPVERMMPDRTGLPWFADRGAAMLFRLKTGALQQGPWGVAQPDKSAPYMVPDVVLVPLVGATAAGDRLGQGQGHFDRYIAALRTKGEVTTIGLAWDCQIAETVPTDPWDEVLDFIATPTRLYGRA